MREFTCHGQLLGGSRALVVVAGELDMATCEDMRNVFEDLYLKGARHFAVDLVEVTFMDSSAIGVLIDEYRRLDDPPRVAVASSDVRKVLHITAVDTLFSLCSSREEALAMLERDGSHSSSGSGSG